MGNVGKWSGVHKHLHPIRVILRLIQGAALPILTGVPSSVCMSVGLTVSFISTVIAPATPKSQAVTGRPLLSAATTILSMRLRMSAKSCVRAKIAISSLATAISNCKPALSVTLQTRRLMFSLT